MCPSLVDQRKKGVQQQGLVGNWAILYINDGIHSYKRSTSNNGGSTMLSTKALFWRIGSLGNVDILQKGDEHFKDRLLNSYDTQLVDYNNIVIRKEELFSYLKTLENEKLEYERQKKIIDTQLIAYENNTMPGENNSALRRSLTTNEEYLSFIRDQRRQKRELEEEIFTLKTQIRDVQHRIRSFEVDQDEKDIEKSETALKILSLNPVQISGEVHDFIDAETFDVDSMEDNTQLIYDKRMNNPNAGSSYSLRNVAEQWIKASGANYEPSDTDPEVFGLKDPVTGRFYTAREVEKMYDGSVPYKPREEADPLDPANLIEDDIDSSRRPQYIVDLWNLRSDDTRLEEIETFSNQMFGQEVAEKVMDAYKYSSTIQMFEAEGEGWLFGENSNNRGYRLWEKMFQADAPDNDPENRAVGLVRRIQRRRIINDDDDDDDDVEGLLRSGQGAANLDVLAEARRIILADEPGINNNNELVDTSDSDDGWVSQSDIEQQARIDELFDSENSVDDEFVEMILRRDGANQGPSTTRRINNYRGRAGSPPPRPENPVDYSPAEDRIGSPTPSPTYSPTSPIYSATSPTYSPTSPSSVEVDSTYSATSPTHSPASPDNLPTSPDYLPPGFFDSGDEI